MNDIVYTISRNVALACVLYVQTSTDLTSWSDDETYIHHLFSKKKEARRGEKSYIAAYDGKQRHTCVVPMGTTLSKSAGSDTQWRVF